MFFIESNANTVNYNRPSYIGNAILDLSKLYMFEFHYNYMKKKYGDKCELIYTDTDSFVYDIKCDDLYKDNFDDRDEYFDLSEVAIEKFKDEKNAKVIGKMKDESNFIPITEFCSLAPKSYSFKTDLDEIKKTCKGVSRAVLKKEISHDDYKNTLKTNEKVLKINTSIRSFKHHLHINALKFVYRVSMTKCIVRVSMLGIHTVTIKLIKDDGLPSSLINFLKLF